jgi:hypothetical protein
MGSGFRRFGDALPFDFVSFHVNGQRPSALTILAWSLMTKMACAESYESNKQEAGGV